MTRIARRVGAGAFMAGLALATANASSHSIPFQERVEEHPAEHRGQVGGRPLVNVGRIGPGRQDTDALNVVESYSLSIIRGDRRTGLRLPVTNAATGEARFAKPADRIGDKSIRDDTDALASVNANDVYDSYANDHIYPIRIPGYAPGGRVFVGQRREGSASCPALAGQADVRQICEVRTLKADTAYDSKRL